jgi:hypothetical protein
MEECCPNGRAFLKRYAEGRTEKKARVLTCPSSYHLSHFLAMYTHTEPVAFTMRRQYDLHAKESNRRPMHIPTTTCQFIRSRSLFVFWRRLIYTARARAYPPPPPRWGCAPGSNAPGGPRRRKQRSAPPPQKTRAYLSQASTKRGVCASLPADLLPVDATHVAAVPSTPAAISAKPPAVARPTSRVFLCAAQQERRTSQAHLRCLHWRTTGRCQDS